MFDDCLQYVHRLLLIGRIEQPRATVDAVLKVTAKVRILVVDELHGSEILGASEVVGVEHHEPGVLKRSTCDLDLSIMPSPGGEDEDYFLNMISVAIYEDAQKAAPDT